MVGRALLLALAASAALRGGDLSPTAAAGLSVTAKASPAAVSATVLAPMPSQPVFEKNHPVEDFFTVTVISAPFCALWSLLGASIVAGISQNKYPPDFSDAMFIGAGAVALGAAAGNGLLSVYWGRGKTPTKNPSPPQ